MLHLARCLSSPAFFKQPDQEKFFEFPTVLKGRLNNLAKSVMATREGDRQEGCDILTMHFVHAEHLNAKAFRPLLKEHAKGFREIRGE